MEREVEFDFAGLDQLRLALRAPDFTTAARIEDAINRDMGRGAARMMDGGTVMLMRRNASGQPLAQCGLIRPGEAVIVSNPVAGAVYQALPQSGNPVFRADQ